jgi:hypothetical protein
MVGCDKANYGSLKGMQIFITDGNDDVAVRSTSRDASAITPIRIDVSPEYGMTYYGLLVDVVFYEFQMADFSLRWYGQDYGSYKARDVLIKKPGETVWKYPYFHRASNGTLTFVIEDSRKETKNSYYLDDYVDGQANTEDCYISIVYDGLGDGPAGRPDQFEPYLHPLLLAGGGNTYNKYLSLANNYGIFSPLPQEK